MTLKCRECIFTGLGMLVITGLGVCQTTTPATDSTATPAHSRWSVGPIDIFGLFDGYASKNFNDPASGKNLLRNFDTQANAFDLNMAKIALEHLPGPVGFRVDAGFGRGFDVINQSTPPDTQGGLRHLLQAYVSLKPAVAKGLQVDVGKFYTSAGAELTETQTNWAYSRSFLFALGPYTHFGVRTSMPVGKHFTGGVQVVNGWNNVMAYHGGPTVGITTGFTSSKVNWYNNYYVGEQRIGLYTGKRHFYDTVLNLNPTSKLSSYINFDYGTDRSPRNGNHRFLGIAGAAHYAFTSRFSATSRWEWYNDADGVNTGAVQKLKESTLTGEWKWMEGILTRVEYRRDWSDQYYFEENGTPSRHQSTFLVGLLVFFGPKR